MSVFFAPLERHQVIDVVAPDGLGLYGRQSLEQMQAKYGQVEIISDDEATQRVEASRTTEPKEITKEDFWYLLEVLPPCKWKRLGSTEAFHVSERITESIVTWCVRIGERYFSLDDTDRLAPEQAINKVSVKFFPCAF